jgi:hypothetical protein
MYAVELDEKFSHSTDKQHQARLEYKTPAMKIRVDGPDRSL